MEEYAYMPTDKQFNAQLIEQYQMLMRIKRVATKENAVETIKAIDHEIRFLKLKLQPVELPEDNME
ncbi:MAG: hypothetical protein U0L12_11090 [Ruminococcus sp.]|nr:hypothetical protein [Ruminococcus sp.]